VSTGTAPDPPHPPRELAVVGALSLGLALSFHFVPEGGEGTFLKAVRPTLWVLAWIAPSWLALEWRKRDPLEALALSTRPRDPLSWILALATLPLYALGFVARQHAFHWTPFHAWSIPQHLFFAALPEETFFRGSLQPSLLPRRPYASIIIVSVLFALAHLIERPAPERLLVFFPSLVFGWLRLRSGSIVPGMVFHTLCNVLEEYVRSATQGV